MGGKQSKSKINSLTLPESIQMSNNVNTEKNTQSLVVKNPFVTINIQREKETVLEDYVPDKNDYSSSSDFIIQDVNFVADKSPTDKQILNAFTENKTNDNRLSPILVNSIDSSQKTVSTFYKFPFDKNRNLILTNNKNLFESDTGSGSENENKKKQKGVRFSELVVAIQSSETGQTQMIPIKNEDSESGNYYRNHLERERYNKLKSEEEKTHQNLDSLKRSLNLFRYK